MRRTLLGSLAVAGFVVCGAVAMQANGGDDDNANRQVYQTANLFQPGNPANQFGGAVTLLRSKQRLDVRVATSGLNPNSAHSVWFVLFHNPSACSPPCNVNDLGNPAVRASVFYAAGFVTGMDGTGYASGYVDAGPLPEGIDQPEGTVSGLRRGAGLSTEVHIVVRTHGMISPGMVHEQIGTFNGGCNPTCANQQVAVFMPVE